MSVFSVHADVGPGFSAISARASDASTVYWSPAGITRLERSQLMLEAALVGAQSKFGVERSNINGGDADSDTRFLAIPAFLT